MAVLYKTLVLSALASVAVADFHMYWVTQTQACGQPGTSSTFCDTYAWTLVDSNSLSCTAAVNGPEADAEPSGPYINYDTFPSKTQFPDGICNSGPLDFYTTNGNQNLNYYQSGGDGTLLGTCSQAGGHISTCAIAVAADSVADIWSCTGEC